MEDLIRQIEACLVCAEHLDHEPRPVISLAKNSKILVIGQAPGSRVHQSGIPWNDKSGKNLREWLNVSDDDFYDTDKFAIVPMGFCYPGKGKSGDLPPRKECAPLWHSILLDHLKEVDLILLIGKYAQDYYLKEDIKKNLTETVKNFEAYLPKFFVLPHPSPRNIIWMAKNEWFKEEVLPNLKEKVSSILK
ncbi:MAG: uracil-DNA glycosylase family protein [Flavobacteriales bacterium]|nr:uracil-DNA glycosylase family protein [Flavobacteriales bacterium]